MAPPGAIIGQIQAQGAPNTISQVTATQLQHIQAGAQQQTIAISLPQQVTLSPSLNTTKEEISSNNANDSSVTASSTQSDVNDDCMKDGGMNGKHCL